MPALLVIVGALALAAPVWMLRRRLAVVTVVGESMLPTFTSGDRVLVRRAGVSEIRAGQVVVIEKPAAAEVRVMPSPPAAGRRELMIKRVVAVPGDARPDAFLPENLRGGSRSTPQGPTAPGAVVPAGKLVVLGDNPARSHDSRQLGYFAAERLIGVVLRPLVRR